VRTKKLMDSAQPRFALFDVAGGRAAQGRRGWLPLHRPFAAAHQGSN
jgi:hypothetical protein